MIVVTELPRGFTFVSELQTNDKKDSVRVFLKSITGELALVNHLSQIVIVPRNFLGSLGTLFTDRYIKELENKLNGTTI